VLGVIVVRLRTEPPGDLSREDAFSFAFIGAVYVLTLMYGLILRRRRIGNGAAYVQVIGDVLLASCLVYLTGGPESPFVFTYSLSVVAASILLYQRGAFFAATASSVAYTVSTLLIRSGTLRPPQGTASLTVGKTVFLLVTNVLAQFLIAWLANYLGRQLWATGGRLLEREADLKELARLQRQILACMLSGLITCDEDGRVTFINKAAASIFGRGAGLSHPQQIEELIPGVLKLGSNVRRSEVMVETKSGRKVLGLSVTPLEGPTKSLLVVFQDLTDLRALESELRRVDHLAALGSLAAQLAHEIHNPLASMRGSAQMLASDAGQSVSSKRLAAILIRESDRLFKLVEEFLRFARPPAPVARACSLTQLVEEAVEMLRADPITAGIEVELELSQVAAYVDPDQIRQILLNLLRNAFAAVGGRGKIRLALERKEGVSQIKVWDSAGKIPSTDLTRIFDPFYTTREGGTGLGLSIAHSIVRAHGGMIQVSSSPSTGTEFVVSLPANEEVVVASPSC
jgi:two-component system sensor histidine kinase PilS (NtrC family)